MKQIIINLKSNVNRLIDKVIYEGDKQNPDTYWKAKFFVVAMFFVSLMMLLYMPYYLSPSANVLPLSETFTYLTLASLLAIFFIYPRFGYRNLLFLVFAVVSGGSSWLSTYYTTGGLYSTDAVLSAVMIVLIYFITSKSIGFVLTLITILVYVFFYIAAVNGWHDFRGDFLKQPPDYYLSSILVSFGLAALITHLHERSKDKYLKQIKLSKAIIETQKEDMLASITYAKRIQQAKLPRLEDIKEVLPASFVLFRPKDIVSGDFYYFKKTEDKVFIAAADCTGHGVPGAIMSMICSEKLEEAVNNNAEASGILMSVNKSLKSTLRQTASEESTRDGMDIGLCGIDLPGRVVTFSGANRPIWIIRKGQAELEEIKATKKAIGGLTEDSQYFDSREIRFGEGDTFYLTTDGYADTFSKQGKKLTTKKFKELLLSIHERSMHDQEQYLARFIDEWKDGEEQIDDILVIGIRL